MADHPKPPKPIFLQYIFPLSIFIVAMYFTTDISRYTHSLAREAQLSVTLQEELPRWIFILGSLFSLVISGVIFLLLSLRSKAQALTRVTTESLSQELVRKDKKLEALTDDIRRNKAILDNIPDMVWVKDKKSVYVTCNEAFSRKFKIPENKLAGKTDADFFPADLAKQYLDTDKIVLESGKPHRLEESQEDGQGQRSWIEIVKTPIRDQGGRIMGTMGIVRDITNYKETAEALAKERDRAQQYLDIAGVMMLVIDTERKVALINNKGCEILGYPEHEIIGKIWFDHFVPKEALQSVKDDFFKLLAGEQVRYSEYPILTRRGERRMIAWNNMAIQDERGDILGILNSGDDITERVKAHEDLIKKEQEARRVLAELEKAHADLKNAQSQLIQSEKLAAIGHLAAGIAHEINNPIAFISSNLDTLSTYIANYLEILGAMEELKGTIAQKKAEDAALIASRIHELQEKMNLKFVNEDIKNLLSESKDGIARIRKIVADLKGFSRADQDLEAWAVVNVEQVLDSALNIVGNEIKYKAELKKDYGHVPSIKADPQRLGQVFINMLVNATQAIDKRGIISVRTYVSGNFVAIEVKDNGSGIPPEALPKIFDPFFTTKEIGKGTGLGLSISYDIVKKHGGDILVESQGDQGTTFTVLLPKTPPPKTVSDPAK